MRSVNRTTSRRRGGEVPLGENAPWYARGMGSGDLAQSGRALGQALGIATTLIGAFYNPVGTAAGMAAGAGSGGGITAWADEAIEAGVS